MGRDAIVGKKNTYWVPVCKAQGPPEMLELKSPHQGVHSLMREVAHLPIFFKGCNDLFDVWKKDHEVKSPS